MKKILGIGTDIIEISRFSSLNLENLAKRILTEAEYFDYTNAKNKKNFIAKKFSIKESIAKAFGFGIGALLSFKDIEISKDNKGKPICKMKKIPKNFQNLEIIVHISISDSKNLIQTYCIIEIL